MKIYFAPLEGITGCVFRQAYEKNFGGIDCYYTPFVTTRDGGVMKKKELRELLPERNEGYRLVPQIMTNRAEDFCQAASQMAELGYDEVNLNLGCPSGTIVPKGKGAGFLRKPEELDRFLDQIYENSEKCGVSISVKSRIGFYDASEFPELLELYNRYPVKELILHLRTREEFYKGPVHREVFRYAMEHSKNPLCFNGDVCSKQELDALREEYPELSSVMIGRGFLKRPGFVGNGGKTMPGESAWTETVCQFLKDVEAGYTEVMSGDIPVLFKMKEIWTYLWESFEEGNKYFKKIKKTKRLHEYDERMKEIFEA